MKGAPIVCPHYRESKSKDKFWCAEGASTEFLGENCYKNKYMKCQILSRWFWREKAKNSDIVDDSRKD
jgi:hypothetical protein